MTNKNYVYYIKNFIPEIIKINGKNEMIIPMTLKEFEWCENNLGE